MHILTCPRYFTCNYLATGRKRVHRAFEVLSSATLTMNNERENLVYLAKLAEQAERFDEMVGSVSIDQASTLDFGRESRSG